MERPQVIKIIVIAVLSILVISTGYYSITTYNNNREEIMMYVNDVLDKALLPYRLAKLYAEPETNPIQIPIKGLKKSAIADTWQGARSGGRSHEGTDIFAKKGTPVFAATRGYVLRVGTNGLGGNIVYTVGPGGIRYYYAHLDRAAEGLETGMEVTTDTVIGFVGNTGNASTTAPHLHFGVYGKSGATNPYPLLSDQ